MLLTKNEGKEFELPPAGTILAACYLIADLGTQKRNYQGHIKSRPEVMFGWELAENDSNGKPFLIHKPYTASLHEKALLRKDLESWRGKAFSETELKGFDPVPFLGKCCLLSIVHNQVGEKTYSNVVGIMALPKGTRAPSIASELIYFDLSADDGKAWAKLPDWVKKKIDRSAEQQAPEYESEGEEVTPF
jgi:hypothetical protein